jgi:hypothetical protein
MQTRHAPDHQVKPRAKNTPPFQLLRPPMNNARVVLCAYCEPGPAVTNRGNNGVLAHPGRTFVRRDDAAAADDPSHDWTARTAFHSAIAAVTDLMHAWREAVESKGTTRCYSFLSSHAVQKPDASGFPDPRRSISTLQRVYYIAAAFRRSRSFIHACMCHVVPASWSSSDRRRCQHQQSTPGNSFPRPHVARQPARHPPGPIPTWREDRRSRLARARRAWVTTSCTRTHARNAISQPTFINPSDSIHTAGPPMTHQPINTPTPTPTPTATGRLAQLATARSFAVADDLAHGGVPEPCL